MIHSLFKDRPVFFSLGPEVQPEGYVCLIWDGEDVSVYQVKSLEDLPQ